MAQDGPMLTAKQETLMLAMLSSPSLTQAALASGVPERTAKRWCKLPEFKAALAEAQAEIFEESLATLKMATHDAVATLTRVCKDKEAPHSAQIRAAQILLEKSIELHKVADLERKIAEMSANNGKVDDAGSIIIDTQNLTREQLKRLKAFALEMKALREIEEHEQD